MEENAKQDDKDATPKPAAAQKPQPEKTNPPQAAPAPIPVPAQEEPAKPPRSQLLTWSPWILAAPLVGFLLAFILLYLPAQSALSQTRSDLKNTQSQLTQANSNLDTAQKDLQSTQDDLDTAQFDLALADLENNVTYARLALATRDLLTARQEMSVAPDNLAKFNALLNDPDMESALTERVTSIRGLLTTNSTQALDELRALSENLQRIERK